MKTLIPILLIATLSGCASMPELAAGECDRPGKADCAPNVTSGWEIPEFGVLGDIALGILLR